MTMEPTDLAGTDQNSRIAALNAKLLREQNLPFGIAAGIGAALIGALLWMQIVVITHMQIGIVALAVGAGVGYAIRWAGRGVTPIFGIVGAILTLASCLAGETFATVQTAADIQNDSFFRLLPHVDFLKVVQNIIEHSSIISYLIYAIGLYEGYRFSIRKVTQAELQEAGLVPPASGQA